MKRNLWIASCLGACVGMAAPHVYGQLTPAALASPSGPAAVAIASAPPASVNFDPARSFAPLVDQLGPAVVNIHVATMVDLGDHPLAPLFGAEDLPDSFQRQGQGSGFVISADGYILTNNHVVADADEVVVTLADEREFSAKVIGSDESIDVAVVKVETDEPLAWVPLGASDEMRVGDRVIAIGNPFGLSHTVTTGIISAKGRVIGAGPYDNFLQTDASINPGNSGGPLFDLDGRVVGINTAINRYGQGIAYAVPIDQVKGVLGQLKKAGRVSRGWIGVGLQTLDEEIAGQLGLAATSGVLLRSVYEGTPAADAGLEVGDVVVELDGSVVTESEELVHAIGNMNPGEKVNLTVVRNGRKKKIAVKLGERPTETDLAQGTFHRNEKESDNKESQPDLSKLGISVRDGESMGVDGLIVTAVQSSGRASGFLRPGDVILEVNHRTIATVDDLGAALGAESRTKSNGADLFVVERRGSQVLVVVPDAG